MDVRDLAILHLSFEDAPQMFNKFRSGDMLGQSITFTLSFFSKAVVVLEVRLGSLSCWNTALRLSLRKGGDHALLQYVTVHVGIHGSLNEL